MNYTEALAWADRQLGRFASGLAVAGGVALVALMLITVIAVFWRYALNDPIFGIEDVSTMTLTVVVAASVAYGAHHRAHVSVNVISMIFGRKVRRYTDLGARILGLGIVGTASYALFIKGGCGLPCGAITNNLTIVHTPFYYILSMAMGSYAALLGVQALTGLAHWSGTDPNEADD